MVFCHGQRDGLGFQARTKRNSRDVNQENQLVVLSVAAVMGEFPDYLEFARDHEINGLVVPERPWRFYCNSGNTWTMLSAFWRATARSKQSIALTSNPGLISSGSLYAMELEFLRGLGYFANLDGTRLDFGPAAIAVTTESVPFKLPPNVIQKFLRRVLPFPTFSQRVRRVLTSSGPDQDLQAKISDGLSFLFQRHSASVVSNQRYSKAFGNAVLVIQAGAILLRIVRDRDELRFDVAAAHANREWHRLTVAVAAIEPGIEKPTLQSCVTIQSAATLLLSNFDAISSAFQPSAYSKTKASMEVIEAARFAEWRQTFNQEPATK